MENIKQNGLDPKYAYNSNAYEIDDCLFINKDNKPQLQDEPYNISENI